MNQKISEHHLSRKAILYVRQSSQQQVVRNEESRRLQYAMAASVMDRGMRTNLSPPKRQTSPRVTCTALAAPRAPDEKALRFRSATRTNVRIYATSRRRSAARCRSSRTTPSGPRHHSRAKRPRSGPRNRESRHARGATAAEGPRSYARPDRGDRPAGARYLRPRPPAGSGRRR